MIIEKKRPIRKFSFLVASLAKIFILAQQLIFFVKVYCKCRLMHATEFIELRVFRLLAGFGSRLGRKVDELHTRRLIIVSTVETAREKTPGIQFWTVTLPRLWSGTNADLTDGVDFLGFWG